jgi:probable phosphoglycerate mutase
MSNSPTPSETGLLILLRHGQTAQSADGLFSGRQDVSLTKTGEHQAEQWADVFTTLGDQVSAYTSPLIRARQTAALAGYASAQVLPSLTEWDLGDLEGERSEDYRYHHPEWSLFTHGAPAGESPHDVTLRCHDTLTTLLKSPTPFAIAVSHGQFLRALTVTALEMPLAEAKNFSFGPARAAILIRRSTGKLSLAGWNVPPTPQLLTDLT